MERTKHKKPTAILCSDFHLREDTPLCYTGDYQKEQWNSIDFISNLQKEYGCTVFHAGDLFDHWKPSPNLLRKTILHLPNKFYTIYGQHDLPQHALKLVYKCGINTLQAGKHLTVLGGVHWGQTPVIQIADFLEIKDKKILVWHKMNWKGKIPWPGCTDPSAQSLLRKYPKFDLILTGDNHKTFTEEYKGRVLVNPGSMMRMDADQVDHKPCVYLWYAEDNSIEKVYLPIEKDVISREHIEQKKERNDRIDAFISKLDDDWEAAMGFEENLEIFKKKNKTDKETMRIVYKAIEQIKT